jgi:hypothetical protein
MNYTDTEITAAARVYNASFSDAAEAIDNGSPFVQVVVVSETWMVRAIVTPGLTTSEGFIAAADPQVHIFRRRSASDKAIKLAQRNLRLTAEVPITYTKRGI